MLTGTPLQNDLEELQNLLSFLLPDVFNADVAAQLADEQAWARQGGTSLQYVLLHAEQWKHCATPQLSTPERMLLLVIRGFLVADFAACVTPSYLEGYAT